MNAIEKALTSPTFPFSNRVRRFLWMLAWTLLCRASPRPFHAWRCIIIRIFGAKVGPGCHIYPGARIWAPWNLRCGRVVAIADGAEIYNPSLIQLGDYSVISQNAYLCAASHDYTKASFPLISKPIFVETRAWVSARAIVLMGVTIGEGCVIGAGSVVSRDMPPWSVCAGNPCKIIKLRYERNKN